MQALGRALARLARGLAWAMFAAGLAGCGPAHAGAAAPEVDRVVIEKGARRLSLLSADGSVIRVYRGIQLGWSSTGAKHFQGDGKTPEGHYTIDYGLEASAYHLALHLSYPAPDDVAFARGEGRDPGGAIFIHGQPNGMSKRPAGDWTAGCIALSNEEIEEIWSLVGDGTPVDLVP